MRPVFRALNGRTWGSAFDKMGGEWSFCAFDIRVSYANFAADRCRYSKDCFASDAEADMLALNAKKGEICDTYSVVLSS